MSGMETTFCGSLVAVASETHRADPAGSQDAATILRLPHANLIAICDGMGSFAHAGDAARFCTRTLSEQLMPQMASHKGRCHPHSLFAWLRSALHQYALQQADQMIPLAASLENTYGTTLILGGEGPDELGVSYVGNGAVFRLPGNCWEFPEEVALPWCWVNLLNPHSRLVNGREALYRYLSPTSTEPMVMPTSLRISKDTYFGDILILVTDGIYSGDQTTVGEANGTPWVQVDARLIALHRTLRTLFCSPEALTQARLEQALGDYLQSLKAQGMLDDDATLGVIVTAATQDYHTRAHRLPDEETA